MRSSRIPALALVVLLAVTGCATSSPPASAPPQVPSTSASPSGEPEQQRETGLTRPSGVFGGQCDNLFTDAELEAVMGEPLALEANHFRELWGGGGVIDQAGGLMCTWNGTQGLVIAIALPEAAVDYEAPPWDCAEGSHDSYNYSCPLESIVNGTRLSAYVSASTSVDATRVSRDALIAIFSEKAAAVSPVPVPIPAVGAWVLPPDCAAVVAGADLSAVPGLGAGSTGSPYGGYGKDAPMAEGAIAGDWSPPTCVIMGVSAEVEFAPIGGSRWREADLAARADATALTLAGVDAAYGVPYENGTTLVYAFSGPNMLMFAVKFTKNAAGIATALIASLDSTAVS